MEENRIDDYEKRRQDRQEQYRQMKIEKEKRRQAKERMQKMLIIGIPTVAALILLIVVIAVIPKGNKEKVVEESSEQAPVILLDASQETPPQETPEPVEVEDPYIWTFDGQVLSAASDDHTGGPPADTTCEYCVLIDVQNGRIVCQKDPRGRINPASMTKVLTVLVAAEHVKDLDDKVVITREIADYCFVNDCSIVGYEVGEEVPVRDLFFGTIMPSGADAAVALACYVSGDQDSFVELMNEKLAELGLDKTSHFTNCVGLYDSNHYSTCYDMAVIMKAATDSPFVREVLSQHVYTTVETAEHPEGITISNLFLRRIEDHDSGGEVLCAKTGYVLQSKNCAVSLAKDKYGLEYICVTAGSNGPWPCIYDHRDIYKAYLPDA